MKVHVFQSQPPEPLARQLADFERQFDYPLGVTDRFRISHGEDYTRFFRAMGKAALFAVEQNGQIIGMLATAERQLRLPDGSECAAVYVGDLKIAPASRGGRTLACLLREARAVHANHKIGFSVVMDGTLVNPTQYTGRLGVPIFQPVAQLMVLRIPTSVDTAGDPFNCAASEATVLEMFRQLSQGRLSPIAGRIIERAQFPPAWLALPDGSACGIVEDTLRAKRLISAGGKELVSAHLSSFAYATPEAGARLLRAAMVVARDRELPALFVSIPRSEAALLAAALGVPGTVCAPATVYGTGLPMGPDWNLNTSEI